MTTIKTTGKSLTPDLTLISVSPYHKSYHTHMNEHGTWITEDIFLIKNVFPRNCDWKAESQLYRTGQLNWHCDCLCYYSLPTHFIYLSKSSLLPSHLCTTTFVLHVLSSTKPARRSCLPAALCEPYEQEIAAEWLPLSRQWEQTLRTHRIQYTHLLLMLCYWSSGTVQNTFNRTGFFVSLHGVLQDFGHVLCVILDLFWASLCGLYCSINLVCACLKPNASTLALIWLWVLVLRVTSHPKQQNLLYRSLFCFSFLWMQYFLVSAGKAHCVTWEACSQALA